jgi:hypothetical protein
MVSFKTLLVALVAQGLAVSATPIDTTAVEHKIAARADGQIYYCEHAKWKGTCRTVSVPLSECRNIHPDWNDRVSSIKNNQKGSTKCVWYREPNCKVTNTPAYTNQEDANLADGNGNYNDSISSYECFQK